jgi:hypothetical protein
MMEREVLLLMVEVLVVTSMRRLPLAQLTRVVGLADNRQLILPQV